jgi:bifunctional non-homologous end joining protein LigD
VDAPGKSARFTVTVRQAGAGNCRAKVATRKGQWRRVRRTNLGGRPWPRYFGPRVQLLSRHDIDHARRYPDVAAAVAALPVPTVVLDGELAVFAAQLRSRFDWLRRRQPAEIATPPVLIGVRRALREGQGLEREAAARAPTAIGGSPRGCRRRSCARGAAPGAERLAAWAQVLERGYEGLVAKDEASLYGGRTRAWLKVKQANWTEGEHR